MLILNANEVRQALPMDQAIAAMKELGYDLSKHDSKSLKEVEQYAPFDAVVTMGCGDACPWMPAKKFIDWEIPDPKNMNASDFNKVRDLIEEKVKKMLQDFTPVPSPKKREGS